MYEIFNELNQFYNCTRMCYMCACVQFSDYADLVSQLNKLPVRSDTLRTRIRKREMESELDKIEAALAIFQREKVYIKPNTVQV